MSWFYFFRFLGLLLLTIYIYVKILNIKNIEIYKKFLAVVFTALISIPLSYVFPLYEFLFILYSLTFIYIMWKDKFSLVASTTFISIGISLGIDIFFQNIVTYIYYLYKIFLSYITTGKIITDFHSSYSGDVSYIAYDNLDFLHPIITFILCFITLYFIFKAKPLKKGFIFLKIRDANILAVIVSILIMFSRSYWGVMLDNVTLAKHTYLISFYFEVFIFICVLIINFWWKYNTKIVYQSRVKDRTIGELEIELEKLSEDNKFLLETFQNDNIIIPVMYKSLKEYLLSGNKTTFNHLEIEMKSRNREVKRVCVHIAKTGVKRVDSIISYMHAKALEIDITLDSVIATDINLLIQKHIAKQDFETLLADLLENAIIATSFSESKKILLTICLVDNIYELTLQDSGIPFKVKTLYNLGVKRSSTHLDNGGTGIGYMKIFEILKEFKASIIITENVSNLYTKSITIKFDNESKYIIYTDRLDKLKILQKRPDVFIFSRS